LLKGPRRLFDAAKNISLQDKSMAIYFERERERDPSCKISALKMDKGHYQSHDSSLRRLELSQQKLIESKLYYDVSLALYPAIVH
jgi:hypothetical protein